MNEAELESALTAIWITASWLLVIYIFCSVNSRKPKDPPKRYHQSSYQQEIRQNISDLTGDDY